jgi:hypothetical protein
MSSLSLYKPGIFLQEKLSSSARVGGESGRFIIEVTQEGAGICWAPVLLESSGMARITACKTETDTVRSILGLDRVAKE